MNTNSNLVGNSTQHRLKYSQSRTSRNDDAPYSPTDLEKVLCGWDADAGTLPSRLWDVVDSFDPLKLVTYDPYRVAEHCRNVACSAPRLGRAVGSGPATCRHQSPLGNHRELQSTGHPQTNAGVHSGIGCRRHPGIKGVNDDPDGAGPITPRTALSTMQHEIGAQIPIHQGAANPLLDDFQRLPARSTAKARSLMCCAIVCSASYRYADEQPHNLSDPQVKADFRQPHQPTDVRAVAAGSCGRREDGPQSPIRRWQGQQWRWRRR